MVKATQSQINRTRVSFALLFCLFLGLAAYLVSIGDETYRLGDALYALSASAYFFAALSIFYALVHPKEMGELKRRGQIRTSDAIVERATAVDSELAPIVRRRLNRVLEVKMPRVLSANLVVLSTACLLMISIMSWSRDRLDLMGLLLLAGSLILIELFAVFAAFRHRSSITKEFKKIESELDLRGMA